MKKISFVKLIISIVICLLAGFIGSIFTTPSIDSWYTELQKPFFNPPNWIFAPVWTALYILMGISFYIIWNKTNFKSKESRIAGMFFGIQLLLNLFWSIIFFGLESPFFAFVEIILLWFAIIFTMIYFYRISRPAAYLLVPYILWVSFAAILNFSIYLLN